MAQIEIQDDWDKPQNIIRIKSADPNDLHEAVTAGLQSAGFATCGLCGSWDYTGNMIEIDREKCEMACSECRQTT